MADEKEKTSDDEGNPFEDVTRLRRPIGVMARGRWFTREQLQKMLTGLTLEQ